MYNEKTNMIADTITKHKNTKYLQRFENKKIKKHSYIKPRQM
jgi:hypothetical protein